MVRSLPVRSLRPKVRSLHSKVRSLHSKVRSLHSKVRLLHQISYFATNKSYFTLCCKVKYYLPMIFKVYNWWHVLQRFEYAVFTLSFRLATELPWDSNFFTLIHFCTLARPLQFLLFALHSKQINIMIYFYFYVFENNDSNPSKINS